MVPGLDNSTPAAAVAAVVEVRSEGIAESVVG